LLALDISSSVDATEDALQRGGLAQALIAQDVQDAFFSSPDPVALAAYEWSGRYNQALLVSWTLIETPADLLSVARQISTTPRGHNDFPTALGYALGFGATVFDTAPACLFQTLDVSGDGENNDGFGPAEAYAAFQFDDITVNGLAIDTTGQGQSAALVQYYQSVVIRGPAAFVEVADGFSDYERAMRRKLIRELSAQILGSVTTGSGAEG